MRAILLFGTDESARDIFLEGLLSDNGVILTHRFGTQSPVGIEEVREIKRKAYLSPGEGVQAFIIERADEMTTEAYQAFLKLLEETPAGSLVVLLASSSLLPQTILSRVEKYSFFGGKEEGEESDLSENIERLKSVMESDIRHNKTVSRVSLYSLRRATGLLHLLHTSRVSRHSIEEYSRATLE